MNHKIFHILALLLLVPVSSYADEWIKPGNETLTFGIGTFLTAFDTTMRVDSQELGTGGDVDFENDLGLTEDQSALWTNLNWRFANKHRLGVSYFSFSRDATATALEDIEIAVAGGMDNMRLIPLYVHLSIGKKF